MNWHCMHCEYRLDGVRREPDGSVRCPECGELNPPLGEPPRPAVGPPGEPLDAVLGAVLGLAVAVWAGIELLLTEASALKRSQIVFGTLGLVFAGGCFLWVMRRTRKAGFSPIGCALWGFIGVWILTGAVVLRLVL